MRRNPWYYFNQAAERATKGRSRNYKLAALAIRNDGAIVCCTNGNPKHPSPSSHAERRLTRKLDQGAAVYVVRVGANGQFRMSRPCTNCRYALKNAKVSRVYYTISDDEYGIMDL